MSSGVAPLQAIAVLLRKFGKRIEGGGYEVEVSHLELRDLSPYGTLTEVPVLDMATLKWQYFPNNTIEGEVKPDVTPEHIPLPPECGLKSTNPHSHLHCNRSKGHEGQHSYGDSYETAEYWD